MALAVGEALAVCGPTYTPERVESLLRLAFIGWMNSPENTRAPGMTCMRACRGLERGLPWFQATVAGSKGCGANMRVQPVGLLPDAECDADTRASLAQFQSALTHGHPTALAASDLTAFAVHDLARGGDPATLPAHLRDYARSQRTNYREAWLGPLAADRSTYITPGEFIARGWDECLEVLDRLDAALRVPDRAADPCLATGDGWIAEEAFATGLLCFLLFPDDPVAALRRAAVTRGDSDSIACLTGAFAGARHGIAAWPADWIERVEYRDRLQTLADRWD